ncbi:hypothetical protein B0H11DRAFT_2430471 [Mycena galericulata]|nr:hypothetical protein B0H11DRAFT_2430471 [Mycena galericulata]
MFVSLTTALALQTALPASGFRGAYISQGISQISVGWVETSPQASTHPLLGYAGTSRVPTSTALDLAVSISPDPASTGTPTVTVFDTATTAVPDATVTEILVTQTSTPRWWIDKNGSLAFNILIYIGLGIFVLILLALVILCYCL